MRNPDYPAFHPGGRDEECYPEETVTLDEFAQHVYDDAQSDLYDDGAGALPPLFAAQAVPPPTRPTKRRFRARGAKRAKLVSLSAQRSYAQKLGELDALAASAREAREQVEEDRRQALGDVLTDDADLESEVADKEDIITSRRAADYVEARPRALRPQAQVALSYNPLLLIALILALLAAVGRADPQVEPPPKSWATFLTEMAQCLTEGTVQAAANLFSRRQPVSRDYGPFRPPPPPPPAGDSPPPPTPPPYPEDPPIMGDEFDEFEELLFKNVREFCERYDSWTWPWMAMIARAARSAAAVGLCLTALGMLGIWAGARSAGVLALGALVFSVAVLFSFPDCKEFGHTKYGPHTGSPSINNLYGLRVVVTMSSKQFAVAMLSHLLRMRWFFAVLMAFFPLLTLGVYLPLAATAGLFRFAARHAFVITAVFVLLMIGRAEARPPALDQTYAWHTAGLAVSAAYEQGMNVPVPDVFAASVLALAGAVLGSRSGLPAEFCEEMATLISPSARFLLMIFELLRMLGNSWIEGYYNPWLLIPTALHVLCIFLTNRGMHLASYLVHLAWNETVKNLPLHYSVEIDHHAQLPTQPRRSFDMDVGLVRFGMGVYDTTVTVTESLRLPGALYLIPIMRRHVRGPYSPEFAEHLASIRTTCAATDTPQNIKTRLIAQARASTPLAHDRELWNQGYVAFTLEAVAYCVAASNSNHRNEFATLPRAEHLLYGYAHEDAPPQVPSSLIRMTAVNFNHAKVGKPVASQLAPSPNYALPRPDPHDPVMAVRAVAHRVARQTPGWAPGVEDRFRAFVNRLKNRLVPLSPNDDFSVETWLEATNYPASRREELLALYRDESLDNIVNLMRANKWRADSFPKDEGYAAYKVARTINSRTDDVKVSIGPLIKALEKSFYRQIPCNIKGIPVDERMDHIARTIEGLPGRLLNTDLTAAEASHDATMDDIIFGLYLHMFQNCPEAVRIIALLMVMVNKAQLLVAAETKFWIVWRLLSGEMDTSLRNFLMVHLCVHFLVEEKYIAAGRPFDAHDRPLGVTEGDDGLYVIEPEMIPTVADFATVNLIAKLDVCDSLAESNFCGIHAVPGPDGRSITLTDPRDCLTEIAWTKRRDVTANAKRRSMLLQARLMSYYHMYNGCPVIGPIAFQILRNRWPSIDTDRLERWVTQERGYNTYERDMYADAIRWYRMAKYMEPPAVAREVVERRYGIPVEEQMRLESLVPRLPANAHYQVNFDVHPDLTDYYARFYGSRDTVISRPAVINFRSIAPPIYFMLTLVTAKGGWRASARRVFPTILVFVLLLLMHATTKRSQPATPGQGSQPQARNVTPSPQRAPTSLARTFAHQFLAAASGGPRAPAVPAPRPPARAPGTQTGPQGRVLVRVGSSQSQGPATLRRTDRPSDTRGAVKTSVNSLPMSSMEEGVPVAYVTTHDDSPELTKPKRTPTADGYVFEGAELISDVLLPPAIGGVTTTVPQGGCLAFVPVNPLHNDALRISRELSQYDQWRIEEMVLHYEPMCPTTTSGGIWGAFIADMAEGVVSTSSLATLRDMAARPGSAEWPPYCRASVRLSKSLFKWYYTRSTGDETSLVDPGYFVLASATAQSNAGAAVPWGQVWMKYRIRVVTPSFEKPGPLVYTTQSASLSFTTVTRAANTAVQCGSAAFGVPASFYDANVIGWGIVASADDAAVGNNSWRTWHTGDEAYAQVISPGNLLFFRAIRDAAGAYFFNFYPTFDAATRGNFDNGGAAPGPTPAWLWTNAGVAAVCGFKVWGISGCPLDGDV